jgi:hypothetical protein
LVFLTNIINHDGSDIYWNMLKETDKNIKENIAGKSNYYLKIVPVRNLELSIFAHIFTTSK